MNATARTPPFTLLHKSQAKKKLVKLIFWEKNKFSKWTNKTTPLTKPMQNSGTNTADKLVNLKE